MMKMMALTQGQHDLGQSHDSSCTVFVYVTVKKSFLILFSSQLKHPERSDRRVSRRVLERLSSPRAFFRSLVFSHKGSLLTHTRLFLQLPFLLQLLQEFPPQTSQFLSTRGKVETCGGRSVCQTPQFKPAG